MNRPPRGQANKYPFPLEPRSTTELVLRQLAIFAIFGIIILVFYVMGFWDELYYEVRRLVTGTPVPVRTVRAKKPAEGVSKESKKDS